jgi:hypothetical protein
VFVGNVAEGDTGTSGGAYVQEGVPTPVNCTFTVDTAAKCGGVWATPETSLANCIPWSNSDDGGTGESAQAFCTEDDDLRLPPGSVCIDAGCNSALPRDWADLDDDGDTREITPLDLEGEGRFFDNPDTDDAGCCCPPIVDMGAYESGDTEPQPCPGDLDCARVVGHSDLAILLAAWHNTAEGVLNCDGFTDHADLGILLADWGCGT